MNYAKSLDPTRRSSFQASWATYSAMALSLLATPLVYAQSSSSLDALQRQLDEAKAQKTQKATPIAKPPVAKTHPGAASASIAISQLVVRSDSPCTLFINGVKQINVLLVGISNINLPAGQSLVDCISTQEPEARFSATITARPGENAVAEIALEQKISTLRQARLAPPSNNAPKVNSEPAQNINSGVAASHRYYIKEPPWIYVFNTYFGNREVNSGSITNIDSTRIQYVSQDRKPGDTAGQVFRVVADCKSFSRQEWNSNGRSYTDGAQETYPNTNLRREIEAACEYAPTR